MIDSMIRDYKREVETLYEKIEKLLVGDDYKRQLADIRIALDKSNPSLMFYGIYNAGKSSLTNNQ